MKKVIAGLIIIVVLLATSCFTAGEEGADAEMNAQTRAFMEEAQAQVGMPAIVNFQERKLAKMIFELRDQEDLVCYAYIVNLYGELIFIGECVGYGLPYSVQFTNPLRIVDADREGSGSFSRGADAFVLPQADPNGLFMPNGLSATWLMLIDDNGVPRPVYIEPQIMVSPFPLH